MHNLDASQLDFLELLKDANDFCDNNNISGSVKICKSVIKKSPKNHVAVVVYGKSAMYSTNNKHEAPKAFETAISIEPNCIEAYYGLAKYYECVILDKVLALTCYEKLLVLEKKEKTWLKLYGRAKAMCESHPNMCIYGVIAPVLSSPYEQRRLLVSRDILETALKIQSIPSEFAEVVVKAYVIIMKTLDFYDKPSKCKQLLELLVQAGLQDIFRKFTVFLINYDIHLIPKRNSYLKNSLVDRDEVYVDYSFSENHYCRIKSTFKSGVSVPSLHRGAFKSHAMSLLLSLDFDMVVKILQEYRTYSSQNDYSVSLVILKIWSMTNSKLSSELCCVAGEQLFGSCSNSLDILLCSTYTCIALGYFQEAITILRILYLNEFHIRELNMLYAMTKAVTSSLAILRLLPESFFGNMYSANLKARIGNIEEANQMFQRSIIEGKHNFLVYDWMSEMASIKMKKEMYKLIVLLSYKVNNHRWEQIDKLTDLDLGVDTSVSILEEYKDDDALRKSKVSILGSYKAGRIRSGTYNTFDAHRKAAANFRFCMEKDMKNRDYVILLAAHLQPIKYFMSARIIYEILAIQKNGLFPFIMASKMLKKAKSKPMKLVEQTVKFIKFGAQRSVIALESLADANLKLALLFLKDRKFKNARNCFQYTINLCLRALRLNSQCPSIWKTLGDSFYYIGILPSQSSFSFAPKWFCKQGREGSKHYLDNVSSLKLSTRCYYTGLLLSCEVACKMFWHDCALSVLKLAELGDQYLKSKRKRIAFLAIQKSLVSEKSNWKFWNLLGIIAGSTAKKHNYLSGQSFEKANDLEINNCVSLSNQSILYWNLTDNNSLEESLRSAIIKNCDFGAPWIIQGIKECASALQSGHKDGSLSHILKLSKRKPSLFGLSIIHYHASILLHHFAKVMKKDLLKMHCGYFDIDPRDLIEFGEALENIFFNFELAALVYLKSLLLMLPNMNKNQKLFMTCLFHSMRLSCYKSIHIIFGFSPDVLPCNFKNSLQWVYLAVKKGDIEYAFNQMLIAMENMKKMKTIDKSAFYFLTAIFNLSGKWFEARQFYLDIFSTNFTRLFISSKYAVVNQDEVLLKILKQCISDKSSYNQRLCHFKDILATYEFEMFNKHGRLQDILYKNLPSLAKSKCYCNSESVKIIFYSCILNKDIPGALFWLSQLLKSPWNVGSLEEELIVGSYLAMKLMDLKFCVRAIHIYPHIQDLWLLMLLHSNKMKTYRHLHFFKKLYTSK